MCSQKPRDTIRQKQLLLSSVTFSSGRGQLKCDDTRAENRFRLSAKRTSPFKSAGGGQFSRLLAAEVCASVVVMLDTPCSEAVWRVLATHSIRQFPLHFLSWASPCAITFQLKPTAVTNKIPVHFIVCLMALSAVHNILHRLTRR